MANMSVATCGDPTTGRIAIMISGRTYSGKDWQCRLLRPYNMEQRNAVCRKTLTDNDASI